MKVQDGQELSREREREISRTSSTEREKTDVRDTYSNRLPKMFLLTFISTNQILDNSQTVTDILDLSYINPQKFQRKNFRTLFLEISDKIIS